MLNSDKLEFALGQIHALTAFASALAKSHQDVSDLVTHFQRAENTELASINTGSLSDPVVLGFKDLTGQLRRTMEKAVAIQDFANSR
jgi:hypothetical protein